MITPRGYQSISYDEVHSFRRSGARNIVAVMPTGAGKTVFFSMFLQEHRGRSCAIAHRKELVGQMSLTLARFGVRHSIVAPEPVVQWITRAQVRLLGRCYYDPKAPCTVASVDTLKTRMDKIPWYNKWAESVTLWVCDEAHHLLRRNKWGQVLEGFRNAWGLGVTATPERTDGLGLGSHADGVFDALVVGPSMRDLIDAGYLSDFVLYTPPPSYTMDGARHGSTGDWTLPEIVKRAKASRITGDIVGKYLELARGKLGMTFMPDIETAKITCQAYIDAGVPAEVVTAKTPERLRMRAMERFQRRELLNLVNVDLYGEGVDVPELEVVSMGRATDSYGLFIQQFGRALRKADGKPHAIIIDHVGNILHHAARRGRPDTAQSWTLDRRDRRKKETDPDLIKLRACPGCSKPYEVFYPACPYCGYAPEPVSRSAPEFVDGDLTQLDPAVLDELHRAAEKLMADPAVIRGNLRRAGLSGVALEGAVKQHRLRLDAQAALRAVIALWAGHQRALGRQWSESYRRFNHRYRVDVASAKILGRPEAEELTRRIQADIDAGAFG